MNVLSIGQILVDDAELVIGLFDKYRVFYNQPSDIELARRFIKKRLANWESVIFVALADGKPAGFVQLYPKYSSMRAEKNWILNDLYVDEPYRRLGIATKLIQAAMDFAKTENARFVQLETQIINYNAQHLYESVGFTQQTPDNEFIVYRKNVD